MYTLTSALTRQIEDEEGVETIDYRCCQSKRNSSQGYTATFPNLPPYRALLRLGVRLTNALAVLIDLPGWHPAVDEWS